MSGQENKHSNLPNTCLCGKPMHMSPSQIFLYNMMREGWGEKKKVKMWGGKMYWVPTYYIIKHGVHYEELVDLVDKLEEVKN